MDGIVIELQRNLISDECDVLMVLRKAKIIAKKLNLSDFNLWIERELNGYEDNEIPTYRKVSGLLRAISPYHGVVPVQIGNNELERKICKQNMPNPISDIINFSNEKDSNHITAYLPGEMQNTLNKLCQTPYDVEFVVFIDKGEMKTIIEAVKNILLNWTLELELKGIVGEGLVFSSEEQKAAKELPPSINNFYGQTNIISAPVENAPLMSGDNNNITINKSIEKEFISEVKKAIDKEKLTDTNKEKALQLLTEISEKIEQKQKSSTIKATYKKLMDFLIGVGASVAAELIKSTIM